jgi:hypothetical protein
MLQTHEGDGGDVANTVGGVRQRSKAWAPCPLETLKRGLLAAAVLMAAALAAPAAASATLTCTIAPVGVNAYFNPGDLNPPYFFVGESNEQATCSGGAWYETTQIEVQNPNGNFVPEHCGNQGSTCYRLRPGASWAEGSERWCTVTSPPNDPTDDFGAPCAFKSVDQDPCVKPMKLLITVFDASTLLPVTVAESDWICATGM